MNPEQTRKTVSDPYSKTTYLGTRKSVIGREEHVGLRDYKRLTHVLNVGPTGYGKTQLLVHAAIQDAYKGRGLCIINPKDGLINEFIAKLPENRWDDVVYINPDSEQVTPINVLEPYTNGRMSLAQKQNQKEIIVSDITDLFRRRSNYWGDRFGRVLETLLRAYLDLNLEGGSHTLVDIYRAITDDEELTELISSTSDPVVRGQLVKIKEEMTSNQVEPLQRRLNDFLMNPAIRRTIEHGESGIDFRHAIDNQKIILVDIQKGEVGKTVSELIGSIVITKIWAAAQSRVSQPVEDRTPFYLFVDELQNFSGEGSNFSKLLSEAREYKLGCWLCTQYLRQLPGEMRRAVTNNSRTKIFFNPDSSEDLSRITGMLQGVQKYQLETIGKYRAVIQRPGERRSENAVIFNTYPPWNPDYRHVKKIKQYQANPRGQEDKVHQIKYSVGPGNNAGGETHRQLLFAAKKRLEQDREGVEVKLLHQDTGSDRPDGEVILPDGSIAHLEAEHSTLSKPVKVLTNYQRATSEGLECIFVVQEGNAKKLENILVDPVNRRGQDYEDENGSYSYYTSEDGEFADTHSLKDGEYRIIEINEDGLKIHNETVEAECPELETLQEKELEQFCLYREEDGYCTSLGEPCVLTQADD